MDGKIYLVYNIEIKLFIKTCNHEKYLLRIEDDGI